MSNTNTHHTDVDPALARLFQETAGPAEPQTAHRRRRQWTRFALAIAVPIAAIGIALYQWVLDPSGRHSSPVTSSAASCATAVEYSGQLYLGNRVTTNYEGAGDGGQAVAVCGDVKRSTSVTRLAGISQNVAVSIPGESGVIYIANGRCTGTSGEGAIRDCLMTILNADGQDYVRTEIPGLAATTTRIGSGLVSKPNEERLVETSFAALNGSVLPPSLALAVDEAVYVAINACEDQSSLLREGLRCR
ncbi:MAG: hypothetical protein WKF41_13110 [Gaiellaceae bacterium]